MYYSGPLDLGRAPHLTGHWIHFEGLIYFWHMRPSWNFVHFLKLVYDQVLAILSIHSDTSVLKEVFSGARFCDMTKLIKNDFSPSSCHFVGPPEVSACMHDHVSPFFAISPTPSCRGERAELVCGGGGGKLCEGIDTCVTPQRKVWNLFCTFYPMSASCHSS